MRRISRMPWMVPSSPGRPCSTLKATSGLSLASTSATSRPTSMRATRWPWASSASAQALPERSEISRSADQPPIKTATCFILTLRSSRPAYSDPHDLPLELDAGISLHPPPHFLAERLDVGGGSVAAVDQEIAMELRDLCA